MKKKDENIGEHFLPQRREGNEWRSMGFPQKDKSKAIVRAQGIEKAGYEARVIRRRATVVWGR